jgi:sec-independent protein translocase protein TatB
MARGASAELRDELGTDFEIEDLHPKRFVRKHLLSEEDEAALTRPLRDAMRDFEEQAHTDQIAAAFRDEEPAPKPVTKPTEPVAKRVARYDTDIT